MEGSLGRNGHFMVPMSSRSVNKVILVGNLGTDPEVKYTPNGAPVAKFSLATNEQFKDRSGKCQERTAWHDIVAWQRLAEIVGEYVSKGSRVYIEGKLQTPSWEDRQSGEQKYRTEIVARDLVLLGPRQNGTANKRLRITTQGNSSPPMPTRARYWMIFRSDDAFLSQIAYLVL